MHARNNSITDIGANKKKPQKSPMLVIEVNGKVDVSGIKKKASNISSAVRRRSEKKNFEVMTVGISCFKRACAINDLHTLVLRCIGTVSYTHLTLPTIYSV